MKYIAYCRKSTESEDRQVQSIESQATEMLKLAEKDNIVLDKIFKESMSAKAPGRPVFAEMMKYIEKQKDCVIYTWKLDRLARNAKDGGEISWFMDRGLVNSIVTFERTIKNSSDDKFMMSLEFGMAKKYVDDLSVNVKRGLRTKLEKGEYPGPAPLGYLNDKITKKIIIDPIYSKCIIKIFDLYTTGSYSTRDIEKIMYADGFRTKSGKKIWKSVVQRILTNHLYCGLILRNGKVYKATHTPLVSKDTFDKVQEILNQGCQVRKQIHIFPYRGFMHCEECGCLLTATKKKGHVYYYCTNGRGKCEQHKKYLRSELLDKIFADIFNDIAFDEELIEIAYQANKEKKGQDTLYLENAKQNLLQRLENNRQKQDKLLNSYLGELIDENVYKAKTEYFNIERKSVEQDLERLNNKQGESTLELIKEVFLLPNKAKKIFLDGDDSQKRQKLESALWNLTIKNKNLATLRLKEPFSILKKSPKMSDFSNVLRGIDEVRTLLEEYWMVSKIISFNINRYLSK